MSPERKAMVTIVRNYLHSERKDLALYSQEKQSFESVCSYGIRKSRLFR